MFRNKLCSFSGVARALIALLVFGFWIGIGDSFAVSAGQTVIIGKIDGGYLGFRTTGLVGDRDFTWVVGVNHDVSKFPADLATASTFANWNSQGGTVERIRIEFDTDNTVKSVTIDVSKAGAETLVMDFDGNAHKYLAKSIGSNEGGITGTAELHVSTVSPRRHTLILSLADDGLGNGTCFIDGIKITAN